MIVDILLFLLGLVGCLIVGFWLFVFSLMAVLGWKFAKAVYAEGEADLYSRARENKSKSED